MAIDATEFVAKWVEAFNKGENQSWIAEEFKTSRQNISVRAVGLRKRGVKLPKLSNSSAPKRIDVPGLNKFIEQNKKDKYAKHSKRNFN